MHTKEERRDKGTYEVRQGGEGDEIVVRVRLDEQLGRRAETDSGVEVGEGKGDGPAAVHVAGVAQQPHPSVRAPLQSHLRRRCHLLSSRLVSSSTDDEGGVFFFFREGQLSKLSVSLGWAARWAGGCYAGLSNLGIQSQWIIISSFIWSRHAGPAGGCIATLETLSTSAQNDLQTGRLASPPASPTKPHGARPPDGSRG